MLDEIIKLRKKGLSFRKIANELESTVGKIQYQWNKYMKNNPEEQKTFKQNKEEQNELYISPMVRTSINTMMRNNGMEAWSISATSVFVFWKIPQGKWDILTSYYEINSSNRTVVLKINDITSIIYNGSNAHSSKQITLTNGADYFVVSDLAPNRSYCFEIGVFDHYQTFLPVLQSNPIQLPRTSKAHVGNLAKEMEKWVEGKVIMPNWIEHVSTYSYYKMEERKDVEKK
ncbi:DUF4912 domain-containing protein [Niallia sp. 01092]|uniref:DUF4912 domain-containing protein n=1 Tax=unclassified Niallia TaxID=2837522 RepID=UPI003FD41076